MDIVKHYKDMWGVNPEYVVSAPGRINIIGEHTDYNLGLVLPGAINRRVWTAGGMRMDKKRLVYSLNLKSCKEVKDSSPQGNWSDYIGGVTDEFLRHGANLGGVQLMIWGDVPQGGGLSSSAALEISVGFLLTRLLKVDMDLGTLAHMAQGAEHRWVGVDCGIMDQFTSALGKKDELILLDCRDKNLRYIKAQFSPYHITLVNSHRDHRLKSSSYNKRREECHSGVKKLSRINSEIKSARDITPVILDDGKRNLTRKEYLRLRHVVSENQRVLLAARHMEDGRLKELGRLLYKTHKSLKEDYEVSCRELDILVEIASRTEGVVGSRMVGAGFGGCTLNLVHADGKDDFFFKVKEGYKKRTGILPDVFSVKLDDGVRVEYER